MESNQKPNENPGVDRFVEDGEDAVIDTLNRLVWCKKDSWQSIGKWMSWRQLSDHVQEMNKKKFAGYGNWRLPSAQEAKSLFDKKHGNKDNMGQPAYLDPAFPAGFGFLCWTSDVRNKIQAVRFGYRKGVGSYDDIYRTSRGATRFVRDIES